MVYRGIYSVAVALVALGAVTSGGSATNAGMTPFSTPVIARPASPVWPESAPDPDVIRIGTTYYAFTTGASWGNHIGVLESHSLSSGWEEAVHLPQGSSALPDPPAWQAANTQNAPTVVHTGNEYVMFYDAAESSNPNLYCLSRAVARSPLGPFVDDSRGPFGPCSASFDGSYDPDVAASQGKLYLVWKENDSGPYRSAQIKSQQLADSASTLIGPVTTLYTQDSAAYPWELTVENPALTHAGGGWWLLFSAGLWTNSTYSEGVVVCSGPTTPCRTDPKQILTSYGTVHGPGGGFAVESTNGEWYLAFAAWTGSCTGEGGSCGRELYMAPIEFSRLAIRTTSLPEATRGVAVKWYVNATGGIGKEHWTANGLPAGLAMHADTGIISGIPTTSGSKTVTIGVTTAGSHGEVAFERIGVSVKP